MGSGRLLYIKPVLNGSEPPDIRAYRSSHPTFPHEATANQFFNEAQFESYRHLGSWVISAIAERPDDPKVGCDMETFLDRARIYVTGAPRVTAADF